MNLTHTKSIRGLSIAVLVISILGIAACVAGIICAAILLPAADNYLSSGGYNSYHGTFQDSYGNTYSISPRAAISISMGAVIGFCIWGMIVSIVTLIAGILGMRNAGKPEAYRPIFIWSIVGAVLSFFCGEIVELVLLIILAVFLNQDMKAAANPAPSYNAYGQPYGGQPGQTYGGQPAQPYGYQQGSPYGYQYPPQGQYPQSSYPQQGAAQPDQFGQYGAAGQYPPQGAYQPQAGYQPQGSSQPQGGYQPLNSYAGQGAPGTPTQPTADAPAEPEVVEEVVETETVKTDPADPFEPRS